MKDWKDIIMEAIKDKPLKPPFVEPKNKPLAIK